MDLKIMFKLFTEYPVQVLNWHDQEHSHHSPIAHQHFKVLYAALTGNENDGLGTPEDSQLKA
jgi:hypothetical protein